MCRAPHAKIPFWTSAWLLGGLCSAEGAQNPSLAAPCEAVPFEREWIPEGVEDLAVAGNWRAWTQRVNLTPLHRAPSYDLQIFRRCADPGGETEELGSVHLPRGGRQGTVEVALADDGLVAWFDANDGMLVAVDAAKDIHRFPLPPVSPQEWTLAVELDRVLVQRLEAGRARIDEHVLGEDGFLPAREVVEWDGSDVHHAAPTWFVRDENWCALGGPGIDGLRYWSAKDASAQVRRSGSGFLRPTFVREEAIFVIEEQSPWLAKGFGSVALVVPFGDLRISAPVPFRPVSFTPEGVFGAGMLLDPGWSGIRPAMVPLAERREVVARWRETSSTSSTLVFGPGLHGPHDVLRLDLADPAPLPALPGPSFPDARPVEIKVARGVERFERQGPPSAEDLRESGLVLLHHGDPNVRHVAGLFLAGRYGSAARPWIRAALEADPNAWPDSTLVRCLAMCGAPEDGRFLQQLLESKTVPDRDWDAIVDVLVLLGNDDLDSWLRTHAKLLESRLDQVAGAMAERESFRAAWAELVSATRGS